MKEPVIYTDDQLRLVLKRISFVNTVLDFKWDFEIDRALCGWLVAVTFERPDTITGEIGRGRGRQEFIRSGTSLSGVVKTAWLLVELLIRHELMEGFRFDGVRIFNPHNSVLDLADLQRRHDAAQ